jgi:PAS domain S-box-containing protein
MEPSKSKIFIVEDESIVSFDIECCLKKSGYNVVGTATSHKELLDKIEGARPNLILMDIRIHGEVDGIECAKQIRNVYGTPIVFLTAHSDKATIDRVTKTKAFSYVLKPFNEKALVANIEMALTNYEEELKLLSLQKSFSTTLDKLNLGVIMFDKDGLISFLNHTVNALTGWGNNKVLGRKIKDLLFDKKNNKQIEIETVIHEEINLRLIDIVAQEGETPNSISFDLSISPIIQDGKVEGGIVVFHNLATNISSALAENENLQSNSGDENVLEICPWCKKWQDEEDNWNQIEEFIKLKIFIELSHKACPICVNALIRNIQLKLEKFPGHRQN